MSVQKSLDRKLAEIRANPSGSKAFIIADAKDADMAYGLAAPGQSPEYHGQEGRFRTLEEYRQLMRDVVRQGLVDIMLMSASSNEVLTIRERLFDNSHITPAARANDTSDIFVVRGGAYTSHPSIPFRTATIDQIQCGKAECEVAERALGADLGLYSLTFNNDPPRDVAMLERYREFRLEAERKGFRHFLEVFDPNAAGAVDADKLGDFINDHIARTLAGVPSAGRPIFLKIAYHGPRAMEALARYAPDLVPGVLGGASGTTFDAFNLLYEAKKYGARAALFGRKINNAEHQLAFIEFLRLIADDEVGPTEAVKAYHGVLQRLGIKPYRPLEEDLQATVQATSYGGSKPKATIVKPATTPAPAVGARPDFDRELTTDEIAALSPLEKIDYNLRRRDRIFGR
ncbi:MAG: hypothetical protein N2111_05075 [Candidatus Sumerlaeaceae bacterium]|nr:hypothetical protein [Candidatus Sumerlaeaceae bacterium]